MRRSGFFCLRAGHPHRAVLSATHQYSFGDYIFTLIGFIGLATPNFLLALIILWYCFVATGNVAVGLFSDE
ncbi:MAG: hypothetical protein R2856_23035 [Caldilineaceae bacterium]